MCDALVAPRVCRLARITCAALRAQAFAFANQQPDGGLQCYATRPSRTVGAPKSGQVGLAPVNACMYPQSSGVVWTAAPAMLSLKGVDNGPYTTTATAQKDYAHRAWHDAARAGLPKPRHSCHTRLRRPSRPRPPPTPRPRTDQSRPRRGSQCFTLVRVLDYCSYHSGGIQSRTPQSP